MHKLGKGWKPDTHDHRDHKFGAHSPVMYAALPTEVDLRDKCPKKVFQQGKTNGCVSKVTSFLIQFKLPKLDDDTRPSSLFSYYNARKEAGEEDLDDGCTIRGCFKQISQLGFASNALWPFDPDKVVDAPPKEAFDEAKTRAGIIKYERLDQSADVIKSALVQGHPVAFGAMLHLSFEMPEVTKSGVVPMPTDDDPVVGGHCMAIVGYDDAIQRFIVRGSYGEDHGDRGYCYFPYDYILNPKECVDFWVLHLLEEPCIGVCDRGD